MQVPGVQTPVLTPVWQVPSPLICLLNLHGYFILHYSHSGPVSLLSLAHGAGFWSQSKPACMDPVLSMCAPQSWRAEDLLWGPQCSPPQATGGSIPSLALLSSWSGQKRGLADNLLNSQPMHHLKKMQTQLSPNSQQMWIPGAEPSGGSTGESSQTCR